MDFKRIGRSLLSEEDPYSGVIPQPLAQLTLLSSES